MNSLSFAVRTEDLPKPKLSRSKPKISMAELKAVVKLAGISVCTIDVKTWKMYFSEQNENICTAPIHQNLNISDAMKLVKLHDRTNLVGAFKLAYFGSNALDHEFELNGTGAGSKWLRITGKFDDECERARGQFICILTDISAKKQNEVRRNELAAMLNHDLRTPLTTIKLYLQMFAKLAVKSEQYNAAELLGVAGSQVDRMTNMIENFLTSSVLETGRIKINYSYFEISKLINELIGTDYKQSGRQIMINCPDKVFVNADIDKITQVLHNYISNALKYSPAKSMVIINVRKTHNFIITSVTDHGLGIAPSEQEKLFSKFFRSESEAVQKIKGFGIGLYLVKDIIEEHRGKVWATSIHGKGSTFSFSVPTML